MKRWQRSLGLVLTGVAGLFGMRTPPDPQVVAQVRPAPPRSAPTPPARPRREEPEERDIDAR